MSQLRQNTGVAIIFRSGDKIAFVCRKNTGWYDNYYGLPGGKVEPGESFTHAAIREINEEVGVAVTASNLEPIFVLHSLSEDATTWVTVVFEASSWSGELTNAEPHMSSELAWLNPTSLPENTIPNNRYYFEQIAVGNHYGELGWEE